MEAIDGLPSRGFIGNQGVRNEKDEKKICRTGAYHRELNLFTHFPLGLAQDEDEEDEKSQAHRPEV